MMSSTETTAIPRPAPPVDSTPLPKLSASEFRQYNRLADGMQQYHNHFRSSWTTLYKACEANKRPSGISIRQFLALGEEFCSSLTMHHGIEERYIFPVLAESMPNFKDQEHLKKQHEGIHAGLDVFEQYLKDCRSGQTELRLGEMKRIMDTFGEVLWKHLDDEVDELRADNMRKFWTAKEVAGIPF